MGCTGSKNEVIPISPEMSPIKSFVQANERIQTALQLFQTSYRPSHEERDVILQTMRRSNQQFEQFCRQIAFDSQIGTALSDGRTMSTGTSDDDDFIASPHAIPLTPRANSEVPQSFLEDERTCIFALVDRIFFLEDAIFELKNKNREHERKFEKLLDVKRTMETVFNTPPQPRRNPSIPF
eukprot:gnl/Trimastix_PCT/725.p1 GENE.gnl/Trimastix_PCT/725~~gnl/Trimastix_PCT/725.p1  ORF type:complete len:181 (-),score=13.05 gnl/Trimastix_PCT/725:84-626(-)